MHAIDYTGKTLDGRYRITKLIGQGGMGSVYLGQHAVIGKQVAVKFLHIEYASNTEVLKRFYREAQTAAAIGHKNIIEVMDVGASPEGEPFLVMEYLEGEDLESMLHRTGPLSLPMALGVLEPALRALEAAHQKGIVHRDLKPANIFIVIREDEPPTVKLIDFGISKVTGTGDSTKLTQTGSLLGTPAYMAPEQARGQKDIDHRADLYSMAVILYQLLTGELPFKGENYNELLINVLTTEPPRPSDVYDRFPVEAEELILKELSKDPAERSQSAGEMLDALRELSAFEERDSGMTMLASGISKRGVASGDLGSKIAGPGETPSATSVLSELARQATPGSWTGSTVQRKSKVGMMVGIAGGLLALAAAAALVVVLMGEEEQAQAVAPAAPVHVEPEEGVLVEITGMPDGARIIYNGAPVPMNPFRAPRKKTIVPLKVEADGFQPFATSVVPKEDLEIAVTLKPIPVEPVVAVEEETAREEPPKSSSKRGKRSNRKKEAEPAPAPAKKDEGKVKITEVESKKKDPAPKEQPKPAASKKKSKKISEGGKGALFTDDFE